MRKYLLLTLFTLAFISCEKEIPVYTVTVSSSPSEGGSVSPQGGEYQEGQTASFTATPNEFYGFAGWSGADTSTINPISIIVDTNKSLTARFEKLDTDNDGVTDDIDQCSDTPANEQADSNGCSVSQKEFELTVSVVGEGTVTEEVVVAPTIYQGTTQVQLTAVPAEGWELSHWFGDISSTENPIIIEIDSNKNIGATFVKKDTDGDGIPDMDDTCADTPEGEEADENGCSLSQKEFELTVTTEGEGTVTEELIVSPTIYQGTSEVKLTAVPAEGWELIEWTGDATGSENPITIEIDGAKSITAVFAKKDTDGDGVPDLDDSCPDTPSDEEADENGCSISQRDSDNDGVNDHIDQCPQTQSDVEVNDVGCPIPGIYLDENGVTIKATSTAKIGEKYTLNGKEYEIVDNELLRQRIAEKADLSKVCTTFVDDLDGERDSYGGFNKGLFDSFNGFFEGDISSWDVSNVTDFEGTFYGERLFNIDISSWDTSSAAGMNYMFAKAESFNQDISSWDTSKVWRFKAMFFEAKTFNQPLNNWNMESAMRLDYMFERAESFNQNLDDWNLENVLSMVSIFKDAKSFNGEVGNWRFPNLLALASVFKGASSFNKDISEWDVSHILDMRFLFKNASSFNQDIGEWDVSSVNNMRGMFENADSFNQSLSNWDVSNVNEMETMFAAADSFNQDLSMWCTKKPVFMED